MSIDNIEKQAVILNKKEVAAILHGSKTQHRVLSNTSLEDLKDDDIDFVMFDDDNNRNIHVYRCPYGGFGDLLNLVGESSGRCIRLGLKITAIRIEQLQDISHKDAVAEGVNHFNIEARLRDQPLSAAQIAFSRHWDTKHEDHYTDWESNPWVWVIDFEEAAD